MTHRPRSLSKATIAAPTRARRPGARPGDGLDRLGNLGRRPWRAVDEWLAGRARRAPEAQQGRRRSRRHDPASRVVHLHDAIARKAVPQDVDRVELLTRERLDGVAPQ